MTDIYGPTPSDAPYYAVGNGVADDTLPLSNWLTDLKNNGLTGGLPTGKNYLFTQPLGFGGSGWGIKGASKRTCTLTYAGTQSNVDMLTFGIGGSERISLKDFTVKTRTQMTAGAALKMASINDFDINDVDIGGLDLSNSPSRLFYDGVLLDNANWGSISGNVGGTTNSAVALRQCVEIEFNGNMRLVFPGSIGVHIGGGCGGIYFNYLSIFAATNIGLLVDNSLIAAANNQIFCESGLVAIDNCGGHNILLNDVMPANQSFGWNSWSASCHNGGHGMTVVSWPGDLEVGGGAHLLSNSGSGMAIFDSRTIIRVGAGAAIGNNQRYAFESAGAVARPNFSSGAVPYNNLLGVKNF